MRDQDKTKEQLIGELVEMRRRVAKYEASKARKRSEDLQLPKIGEILMEMGYVTRLQLEICLQKQKEMNKAGQRGKLLGEIMVESGIINTEQLLRGIEEQLKRLRVKRIGIARPTL